MCILNSSIKFCETKRGIPRQNKSVYIIHTYKVYIHSQTYGGEVRRGLYIYIYRNQPRPHRSSICKAGMHAWGGAKRGQGPAGCRVFVNPSASWWWSSGTHTHILWIQSGALQKALRMLRSRYAPVLINPDDDSTELTDSPIYIASLSITSFYYNKYKK